MKKKPAETSASILNQNEKNRIFAAMVENVTTMRRDFMKYLIDPKRDINAECGYPDQLSIRDYKEIYDREGIGTRVVDIFPLESWKKKPEVVPTDKLEGEETPWEKSWKKLAKDFNIYAELLTADQISGIGQYGIILLGINDGKALNEPVDGMDAEGMHTAGWKAKQAAIADDSSTVVPDEPFTAQRELIYIRSFDQSVLSIKSIDVDPRSPRYGMPTMYGVNLATDGTQLSIGSDAAVQQAATMDIHWTRTIHLADDCKNNKVLGTPRMQNCFNRVYDGRKLLGGSGEMFWKGGFPGLVFETDPESSASKLTPKEKADLREEMADYSNNLQRYIALMGMTAKSLAPQVADPGPHFEVQCKAIAITKGIPYRVFMGTEEAKLASGQDKEAWDERMDMRRESYITPRILMPLAMRLMAMGIMEEKDITVLWPKISKPTPKEQSEIAKNLTEALIKYIQANADVMIQPLDYLTNVWGLDTATAEAVLEKALLAEDGTLDNVEEPTELDEEAQAANIELTRAKATQAKASAKMKPRTFSRNARTETDAQRKIRIAQKRLRMRLGVL